MKNLPNILSFIRLLLVPVFPIIFFSQNPSSHYLALGIYIIASITDLLDGFIARRYNLITKIGIILDPLADKLMLTTVLFCLYIDKTLPIWVFLFILLNETFMICTGAYMYFKKEKYVIPSNHFGKLATFLFFLGVSLNILTPKNIINFIIIGVAVLIKIIALASYSKHYFKLRRNRLLND